jgi:hypothetical protein
VSLVTERIFQNARVFQQNANREKPYTIRVLERLHDKTHYFAVLQADIVLKPFILLAFPAINQISRNL